MAKKIIREAIFPSSSNEHYKLFFLFFLIINLARIAASIFPDIFLFGLDYYKSFPLWLSVLFVLLSLLFLNRKINERAGQLLRNSAFVFYRENGTIRWIPVILFLGICTTIFYFLRVKPFLGDGVARVQDLDKEYLNTIKDYFVYRSFQFLSIVLFDKTGDIFYLWGIERYKVFYLFNCVSGVVFLYFVFRLQSELFETPLKRMVSTFYLVFQAYLILFMGYIEYYAIPFAMSVMYIYYGIRSINGKSLVLYPAIVLIILIFFHLLGIILLPSLIYLLILKRKQDSVLLRFFSYNYPRLLSLLLVIGIIGTLILRPGPLNMLLISPTALFSFYNYAPFIVFHGSEILNLLIIGACPSLLIIIRFRRDLVSRIKHDSLLNFIVINAFFGLLLILFFKPSGNLAADWDIMTIPLLILNILGIVLLLRYSALKLNLATYGIIISQVLIFFLLWFLVNSIDDAAAHRIITIQNHSYASGNLHKPKYTDGLSFKYYFFIEHNIPKCKEIGEICLASVNDESLREYADLFSEIHELEIGIRFVRKYISYLEQKINKVQSLEWSDYFNLAMYGYLITRQFDEATISLRKAIELNPQNYELHFILGQTYDYNNNVDSALAEYARYDSLYDVNKALIFAERKRTLLKIYDLFVQSKHFDEGIDFFKHHEQKGAFYTYFIGRFYWAKGRKDLASECFTKVLQSGLKTDKEMNCVMAQLFYYTGDFSRSWKLVQKDPWTENEDWFKLVESLKNTAWYKESFRPNK